MISAISQINPNNKYNKNLLFRNNKTSKKENKSDKNTDLNEILQSKNQAEKLNEVQKKFLMNYFFSTVILATAIGGLYALVSRKIKIGPINNNGKYTFESLKNTKNIPLLEDCKSINKDLKTLLEKQLKLSNADARLIEEAGNPNATNRFLLSGPPGAGKTYFSKVYAKTMDAEYLEVLYSDLNSKWAGEVESRMSDMFNSIMHQAKKNPNKKYVVTFNEIDSILIPVEHLTGDGGGTHFASLRRQRSTFVTYMDKLMNETPNITVIGTTNLSPKNTNLDNALMSRFSNTMEVPYPDKNSIYTAIITNLNTVKDIDKFISENEEQLNNLADTMEKRKYSFRNLEFIINEAKLNFLEDKIDKKNNTFKFEYLENAQKALKRTDGEKEETIKNI